MPPPGAQSAAWLGHYAPEVLLALAVPCRLIPLRPARAAALIEVICMMLRRSQKGQGLAEYALILSLIAIVVIAVLLFMGGNIKTILSTIGAAL